MNTNEHEYEQDELVRVIIGAAYTVSNTLGCGFLEKIYKRALAFEIARRGLRVQTQVAFPVFYRGLEVGNAVADLVVDDHIIAELKCAETFCNQHIAQCINYLRASNLKLALLINFQKPRVQWKRIVL